MTSSTKTRSDRQPSAASQRAPVRAESFDWPLANEAEGLVREYIAAFLKQNTFARTLADHMREESATDFFEWCDHLILAPGMEKSLLAAGFARDEQAETPNGEAVY